LYCSALLRLSEDHLSHSPVSNDTKSNKNQTESNARGQRIIENNNNLE
jgi:hypothetical protein